MEMPMKLTPKQIEIANLLASGQSGRGACEIVGVDQTTLVRWKRQIEFSKYYDNLLVEAELDANDALRSLRTLAVERIADLIQSPNPSIALKASEAVLERAIKSGTARRFNDDVTDELRAVLAEYAKFV